MNERIVLVAAAAIGIGAAALAARSPFGARTFDGPGDNAGSGGEYVGAGDAAFADDPGAFQGLGEPDLPDAGVVSDQDNTQLPTFTESFMAWTDNIIGSANVTPNVADANVRAFLDMIAYSEGTARAGDNGYNVMFGGRLFTSYADHPRQRWPFQDGRGRQLTTSAAGRYQFLAGTWDTLRAKLELPDFSPQSQDLACIELIREKGALADVRAGRVSAAIAKCAPVWASLPGAGYAQPERRLDSLVASFQGAGGIVAEG